MGQQMVALTDGHKVKQTAEIGKLLKETRKLRENNRDSLRLLDHANAKIKEYEMKMIDIKVEHQIELKELMSTIKERDDEIDALRKELDAKQSELDSNSDGSEHDKNEIDE